MRRGLRLLGASLVVAGILMLAWVGVVWRWQDPFTYVYTRYEQRQLATSFEREYARYRPERRPTAKGKSPSPAGERRLIASEAARFRAQVHRGQAIGRLDAPRLGLKGMVLVNGTDHDTLKRGPGRDPRTFMPGQGQLVYIAGHRTTYLAPFAKIDLFHKGDPVTIELPYATFEYRITGFRIVPANDLSVLRSRGRETLILQACHPRFFASHRFLAFARPVRVLPRDGTPYVPAGAELAAARRAKP